MKESCFVAFAKLKTYRNENQTKPNQSEPKAAVNKQPANGTIMSKSISWTTQLGTDSIQYTAVYSIYTVVYAV